MIDLYILYIIYSICIEGVYYLMYFLFIKLLKYMCFKIVYKQNMGKCYIPPLTEKLKLKNRWFYKQSLVCRFRFIFSRLRLFLNHSIAADSGPIVLTTVKYIKAYFKCCPLVLYLLCTCIEYNAFSILLSRTTALKQRWRRNIDFVQVR